MQWVYRQEVEDFLWRCSKPLPKDRGDKRTTDVVSIVDKVLSLYMRGMKQRDISSIEDIYVLPLLAEQISNITGRLLDNIHEWLDCLFSSWIAYTLISGVK